MLICATRNDSPLGPLDKWEPDLRTFSCFITTLPHPAALFWGDELVLVHNEAWKTAADGAAVQGKAQKEVLKEDALSLLRTAMMGRTRQSLQSEMFMNNEAQDGVSYQALLSPVMDNKRNNVARGVLVQLFQMSQKQESRKNQQQSIFRKIQEALSTKGTDNQEKNGKTLLDQLSLDDNPFFQRFAAMLPTGMAILNYKAEAVFVNEQFFELTSTTGQGFKAWPQSIHPDDYDRVMEAYKDAFEGAGKNLRVEFRTLGGEEDKWRLLMLSPLGDGVMRDESIEKYGGFVCAVIDITPNKAQELAQKKAAQEAIERKEQQERFIDMISHEIRNPLSAVLHCAEEIFEIVEPRKEPPSEMSEHDTSALLESAETIKLCVTHQKNIVDDILSFSKLDASMLSLRPKSVQPKRQIGDSLKMFQPEFKKQSMNLNYKIDVSYEKHKVDWVRADLVRISQVLVNLVTNAIKFTARKNGEKNITCMMGASLERPTSYPPNVVFFDSEDSGFRMDGTNSSEW
jgi:nitrogen fixation/metabolism regulation signal transduction histidine kinase